MRCFTLTLLGAAGAPLVCVAGPQLPLAAIIMRQLVYTEVLRPSKKALLPLLPPSIAAMLLLPLHQVFDEVAWRAVEPVLGGINGTVFAYGVTSRYVS